MTPADTSSTPSGPEAFFDALGALSVLVIGDLILDRYAHGQISRISPEAPVPVVLHSHDSRALGGAGNVAANIASLGAKAVLIGLAGEDASRGDILKLCEAVGIDASGILASPAARTVTKTRFVSGGHQIIRFDEETVRPPAPDERMALEQAARAAISKADVIVLSDYDKGLFHSGLAGAVIKMAQAAGVPVLADPKGRDYARYTGAAAITPNLKELGEAVGRPVETDADITAASRELMAAHDIGAVLATRSARGMSVIEAGGETHLPTRALDVFDVSGAGDTVIAAAALAFGAGAGPVEAARIANAAAAIAISKRGTAQVHGAELRAEMMRQGLVSRLGGALLTVDQARAAIAHWRREGQRIGFTNGCFDILHFGHVSLLERARAACGRLVVGLNSDASVRRLKGDGRPVNTQADRAALLAALRAVDAVVVFEEDTPLALIEALQPDMLFKGADYGRADVVGGDLVEARGGEVVLLELEEGRSTTRIVETISGHED